MRHRRAAALAVALALTLTGCGRPPVVEEPVREAELRELAARVGRTPAARGAVRGSGEAEITLSGRTLAFSFAVLYEHPGWLRADLKPSLGSIGASLTVLTLMEGGCVRAYLPGRLVEVTGCISDVTERSDWFEPASFVLGLPDPTFLTRLTEATVRRGGDSVIIKGAAKDTRVTVEIDETLGAIRAIELWNSDGERSLKIAYDGHGWKPSLGAPQSVRLVAAEGTSHEVRMELTYSSLRGTERVDRARYALSVPAGVPVIDWRDLSIWR